MSIKVAVVILNWNGANLLRQFLPSVIACSRGDSTELIVADNGSTELIVADNGSTDESLSLLRDEFPEVNILDLKQNYGFAKGYNEALKQLDADYFVLLNSDVEVTHGWLEAPVRLMEAEPLVAAVQPRIRSFSRKTHFEYAGAAGGLLDRFGYPFCRGRIFNVVEEDTGQYDQEVDIFWATGACMFIRARCFREAGGFDADFWAHMEEIDLCWRLKNRGYRIVYTPESTVYHVGGGTLSYDNPQKLFLNFRNNLWLLYKNLPGNQLFYILTGRLILDGMAAFKLLAESNFYGFRSVLRAHAHFYLSLPVLHRKRKQAGLHGRLPHPSGKISGSIVSRFYLRKQKRFSDWNV